MMRLAMDHILTDEEDSMTQKNKTIALLSMVILTAVLMAGCGSNAGSSSSSDASTPVQSGSVVAFGTDAPVCDVESFMVTITSASLVPQGGGTPVPFITSTSPATVDFARLVDFTNILNTAGVAPTTYSQLQMTLTNPQLVVVNTSVSPPAPQQVATTLTTTNFTVNISPALVVSSSTTSGLTIDFNLRKSVQVDGNGQVTGTVDPQFTISANTPSGSTVGEATSVYGIAGTPSTTGIPSGFTGSFPLTVRDGTGQTLTVLVNSSTVFEGDGVTSFGDLQPNTFVEVDATVDTSGDIIAQTVDAEEQVSTTDQKSAFLGRIISITRDGSGNATSFTLLVHDEIPDMNGTIPLHSGLDVALSSSTTFFTNWQHWNRAAFKLSPTTLGLAEKVAVFGTLGSGSPPTMNARVVFLRPRNVLGNFNTLITAGSDGKTGGFTMTPCGSLFGGTPITVLTYDDTRFNNITGLVNLTPSPTINVFGDLFYEQTSGTAAAANGAGWTAPTWVMQARGIHQLPN